MKSRLNWRHSLPIAGAIAALQLTGCATVTNGRTQPVSVQTFQNAVEIVDARCTLTVGNNAPVFVTTPGTVPVRRSSHPLRVDCHKDGVGAGIQSFESSTSKATAGNILFGASLLVALPTDYITGAAYKYPDLLKIELQDPAVAPAAAQSTESETAPLVSAPPPDGGEF